MRFISTLSRLKLTGEGRFWFDLSYDATRVHRQILRTKFCCFLFAEKCCPETLLTTWRDSKCVTQRTAYCDIGTICTHNMAIRVGATSVQSAIHCLAQYVCRMWQIIVWHNFYRWRLGLPLTCDMKCDSEINHANFGEVRANIFRVLQSCDTTWSLELYLVVSVIAVQSYNRDY